MQEKYIAFDVETPNSYNDRMSAIGISVIENGEITDEFYSLVNPEEHFDWFNMKLTGITPESVDGKPTFPELWKRIGPILSSGILIAHNAPFDMGVLAKCLDFYGIDHQQFASYACTCRIGRKVLPDLPNHKLETMCEYLDIDLNHHIAESDARACAEILLFYLDNGIDINKFIKRYDFSNKWTVR